MPRAFTALMTAPYFSLGCSGGDSVCGSPAGGFSLGLPAGMGSGLRSAGQQDSNTDQHSTHGSLPFCLPFRSREKTFMRSSALEAASMALPLVCHKHGVPGQILQGVEAHVVTLSTTTQNLLRLCYEQPQPPHGHTSLGSVMGQTHLACLALLGAPSAALAALLA